MSTLLLICEDLQLSENIIQKMGSEYSIWHVAPLRDAMAWLKEHQPHSIVMDLDWLDHSANAILDMVKETSIENCTMVIGICKSPEPLSPLLLERLDQLIVHHAV
jgi:DNA-binding NtrC family response regulator